MEFQIILAAAAIIAGSVASLAGFGIGSLLTPLLALKTGIGITVAGPKLTLPEKSHMLNLDLFQLW